MLELNLRALEQLQAENLLVVVPGASPFEEPGALEGVARVATEWFLRYLGGKDDGDA